MLVVASTASSGCILIDGFTDVEAEGSGGANAAASTGASQVGPGTGDATSSTAEATGGGAGPGTGAGSPTSSGGGDGGGGDGGSGGEAPVRGALRTSYAFGASGGEDCETHVTDLLRIDGATVVVGTVFGTSICDILVDGTLDSTLNFDPDGNVDEWLAVIGDDGVPLAFDLLGDSFYTPFTPTGLDGYLVTPVRLYRLGPDKFGISRTRYPNNGVKAQLRTSSFDTGTFDVADIGGVSLGTISDGFVFATDMHEEDGIVTVVGSIKATMGASTLRASGDSGSVGLSNVPEKSALRVTFEPAVNDVVSIDIDPASAIWAEVEVVPGTFRVGESGPFTGNPPESCFFTEGPETQFVYATPGIFDACLTEIEGFEGGALPLAFDLQLTKSDGISVVAAHVGSSWIFGTGAADASPMTTTYFDANEFLSLRRTRAFGDRVVFAGTFTDDVGVLDVAPITAVDATDGFALVYDSAEPGHFVRVGFEGDDIAVTADLDDEVVAVGGSYLEPNPDLELASFDTAAAGYVVVVEDPL